MYTEIHFRAELIKNVPEEVIKVLQHLIDREFAQEFTDPLPDHELFQCPRWDLLARCNSAYFPDHPESFIHEDEYTGRWHVTMNADLKNYGGEIAKFFDWIDPYVSGHEGQFLGYSLYEESDDPIIYHKQSASSW
jgi:hypothetical protein